MTSPTGWQTRHTPEVCRVCLGGGWVCENHRDHAWAGTADVEECCGGAGAPCGSCSLQMASAGYVDRREKAIAAWLKSLPPEYSGWNSHDEQYDSGYNAAIQWVAEQIRTGAHWASIAS